MTTSLAIVAAVARNGVIGAQGGMPWRLPTDLRHFKALTRGHPVIMGRRTFESLGRPLPERTNLVVSRSLEEAPGGTLLRHSLEDAVATALQSPGGTERIFVIGGGEIYREAIELADSLLITHVDAEPEGDTRFPQIDPTSWRLLGSRAIERGDKDSADMLFAEYVRRGS